MAFHFAGKAFLELAPGDLNRKSKVSGGQAIAKRLHKWVKLISVGAFIFLCISILSFKK